MVPFSSDFGSKAVRIPSLLLRGEGSTSMGLEQRAARAGGTRQAAHKWLPSRRVICCLSHISLLALYPLKETPVFQRLIPVFQLSLTGRITSAVDQQEILPRMFPGCLAGIICSFLHFPLLKHHVLSSHTPPRQQNNQTRTGGWRNGKLFLEISDSIPVPLDYSYPPEKLLDPQSKLHFQSKKKFWSLRA